MGPNHALTIQDGDTLSLNTRAGFHSYTSEQLAQLPVMSNSWAPLREALKLAHEVLRREGLLQYCGEDCLVDPDGVLGVGDVIQKALALADGTTPATPNEKA